MSSDCSRPVNNYVHVKTADLYRPNARLTPERQGYQVLTPFGKLGYSRNRDLRALLREQGAAYVQNFRFGILEIADTHAGVNDILRRESHWKELLQTREHGYNAN